MDAESGDFLYVNDRACEHLGYERDELLDLHISDIEHNFGHTLSWDEMIKGMREHPRFTVEGKHIRADDSVVPVEVDNDLIEYEGKEYVLAVVRVLSERDDETQEILDHYSQYHTLFKHSPVPLLELDIENLLEWIQNLQTSDFEKFVEESNYEVIAEELLDRTVIEDANEATIELANANSIEHLIDEFQTIVTPDFVSALIEGLRTLLSGSFTYETELVANKISGERVHLNFNAIVPPSDRDDKTRIIFAFNNITPRKKAQERAEERERKLRESEEKFRQIAEHINEVFWLTDPDNTEMIYLSPAFEEIWGMSVDRLYEDPLNFLDHIHEDDRERIRQKMPDQKTGDYDEVYRVCRPDGEIRWVRDRAFPVEDENGEVYRIAGIAEDITEQKRAQQELEQSLEEKKTLLREIHHRVKNNIQIISSLLNMQSRNVDDEKLQHSLENTLKRIKSMALIHERLYRNGHLESVDFPNYLEDLCQEISNFHGKKGGDIDFELNVDEFEIGLEKSISCGLIVNELVTNSIEHGLEDGMDGEISIDFKQIEDNRFELVVSDNGKGMDNPDKLSEDHGTGYDILQALIEYELDGNLNLESDSGFRAEATFQI